MNESRSSQAPRSLPQLLSLDTVALPLRFILTSIVALVTGTVCLVAMPSVVATYHYNQLAIAVTHIFVLGWIGSIIVGAMYQLVPVALETKLHSVTLGKAHFALHVIGWPGMVVGFWSWKLPLVALFGGLFVAGMALFAWNMILTLKSAPRWSIVASGIAWAIAWGVSTVVFGLLVAFAKLAEVSVLEPLAQMHAHAHLGGVGFFTTMLVAVSYKLIPMFVISEIQVMRRAQFSLWLLIAGLFLGVAAMLFMPVWRLGAVLVVSAGLILYGLEVAAVVRQRKRPLDTSMKQFLIAVALVFPTAAVAVVLSWPGLPSTAFTSQLENVYGLLMFFGVLTLAIMAMLHKIVPFLVWYSAYSRHIGRSKVPSLANLTSARLQTAGFACFLPALAGLCAGALCESEWLVRLAALLLLVSIAALVANVAMMINHLWRPRIEPIVRPSRVASL